MRLQREVTKDVVRIAKFANWMVGRELRGVGCRRMARMLGGTLFERGEPLVGGAVRIRADTGRSGLKRTVAIQFIVRGQNSGTLARASAWRLLKERR